MAALEIHFPDQLRRLVVPNGPVLSKEPLTGPLYFDCPGNNRVEVSFIASENPKKIERLQAAGLELPCCHAIIQELQLDNAHIAEIEKSLVPGLKAAAGHVLHEKAITAYRLMGRPCFVEDVLFAPAAVAEIAADHKLWWRERPDGTFPGLTKICLLVAHNGDRRAAVAHGVAFSPDGVASRMFITTVDGQIADQPRGKGMGFDPIFIPNLDIQLQDPLELGQPPLTYSQMTPEQVSKRHPIRERTVEEVRKARLVLPLGAA